MPTRSRVLDRSDIWAVIGAGPSGLSALKALRQLGVPATAFEQAAEVGGNWNFGGPTSRVYESTHTISTKPFTQYPDFPMPSSYPDYPSHRQIHDYLKRYAGHFGLYDHIRFGTQVERLRAVGSHVELVVREKATDQINTYRHAGVVIANGHNWRPRWPQYPGLDLFTGEVMHSAGYRSSDVLRGKRVLVVGGGNTGCDIAVEAGQVAEHAYHSTRRGYWYNPKYAFGLPSDQIADLLLALRLPLSVRRFLFTLTHKLTVGDLRRFGIPAPDHKFYETHPIVNQQLPYYVGHGSVSPKPEIERFETSSVVFTDGSEVDIDLVVFATGYQPYFPFAADGLLSDSAGIRLGRQIFSPTHPAVTVSGLIQPDSGQFALAHWQGMLIAHYAVALRDRPVEAEQFAARVAADLDRRYTGGTTYRYSPRHTFEVAHQEYLRALEDDINVLEGAR